MNMHQNMQTVRNPAPAPGTTIVLPPGIAPVAPTPAPATPAPQPAPAAPAAPAPAAPAAPAQPAATPPAAQPAAQPGARDESVVIGNRRFNNADEALAYLDSMQQPTPVAAQPVVPLQDLIPLLQRQGGAAPAAQPTVDEDEYFKDPQGYIKKQIGSAIKQATDQVNTQLQSERATQEAYNFIFTRHPDLANKQQVVDMVTNEYMDQITKLPSKAERADLIALRVRQRLQQWGMPVHTAQPLQQVPDVTTPGGGGVTPTPQPENDGPVLSFADQLRNMQKRFGY